MQTFGNLVFKMKDLPTSNVYVKFSTGGAPEQEYAFHLDNYSIDILSAGDWKQVTIPFGLS